MASAKLIVFSIAVVFLCAISPVAGYGQTASSVTDTTLSVDELAKSPKAFVGREIVVTGVVGVVVAKHNMFTIIDRSEYAECKVVTCARYEIPIEIDGNLPKPKQVIMATGKLVQPQPGRFLFKARRVEIVK